MKVVATLLGILFTLSIPLQAQDLPSNNINTSVSNGTAPLELGIHAGHFFSSGNIDFTPGFAGGIHLRKALDYAFSLRLDVTYGQLSGEDPGNIRSFDTNWFSGSLDGIVTLNNLKWTPRERKFNFNGIAGVGIGNFSGDLVDDGTESEIESTTKFFLNVGAGVSFKISDRVNIGLEHKAIILTSSEADNVDGIKTFKDPTDQTTFRDVPHYTSVRLNFNLGKKGTTNEPLYWLNPLDAVMNDIEELKNSRVTMTDEDGDGVIDQLDEEEETPQGAAVNPKGVAIDSDNDGLKDYEDKEPFSAPGLEVNDEGVAEQPDIMAEVEKMLNEKLKDFQPKTEEPASSLNNWYIPSIYFAVNSSQISALDYGTLHGIASMMNDNSNQKFVVIGFADSSGSEEYNSGLSYNRAKTVVDQLVTYGVSREQLILNYKGESVQITGAEAAANRRVAFKIATDESEMDAPE